MAVKRSDRLLLVLPIQAYSSEGRVFIDKQACNGLRLWLENFQNVTLACPVHHASPPRDRSPIDQVPGADRLNFISLPMAYKPHQFLGSLAKIAALLSNQIAISDYLHFGIGGLWGDWASVACIIASRANRPFAIWTDRVESKVAVFQAKSKTGVRRAYAEVTALLMKFYERQIIRRSAIGLFHGMDCYSAYSGYCKNPHLVHDIHLSREDCITASELKMRIARTGPIRLVYAGRVHRDKGVFDWIEALSIADVEFTAVWFGDGPALPMARSRVDELGLSDRVKFPGSVESHSKLIRALKDFDAFVFCHKTPESPRCLVEALMCGLPIIGYDSPYPRDLIRSYGGGLLTPINEPRQVAESIPLFVQKRESLSISAFKDGRAFDTTEVFRHRSELMRSI
jgi:glycosyltransferase involved in cell wall biosynthesis